MCFSGVKLKNRRPDPVTYCYTNIDGSAVLSAVPLPDRLKKETARDAWTEKPGILLAWKLAWRRLVRTTTRRKLLFHAGRLRPIYLKWVNTGQNALRYASRSSETHLAIVSWRWKNLYATGAGFILQGRDGHLLTEFTNLTAYFEMMLKMKSMMIWIKMFCYLIHFVYLSMIRLELVLQAMDR